MKAQASISEDRTFGLNMRDDALFTAPGDLFVQPVVGTKIRIWGLEFTFMRLHSPRDPRYYVLDKIE